MTWRELGLGVFAFGITFAESWICSRERAAERQARTKRTSRLSAISANYAALFEAVLLVDIVLTVSDPLIIAPWVLAGAWLGQYLASEKTRKKFRANAGKIANLQKRRKPQEPTV